MNLDGVERHSYFKDKGAKNKKGGGRRKTTLAIFLFLLFCLIFLIIYFFIFSDRIFNQEKSVKLEIIVPEEIFVGQETILNFSVVNQENADLIEPEIFIKFPEKFQYLSSEPVCSEITPVGCFIRFSRLKINEKKEIDLIGQFFGLPAENKTIETKITFQLENFSSWFKKEANKEIILRQPAFDLEFSGSDELLSAEEGQFRIKIKNSSNKLTLARIILTWPDDFNFINLSLIANEEKDKQKIWDIDFEPNEEKIIDFSGYFSDQSSEKRLVLQMGVLGLDKEFFLQQEKEKIVKITQPGLVLGLKVNDSFSEELPQNFGNMINVSLSYKNISQEKIFEPVFKLKAKPFFAAILEENNENWQTEEKAGDLVVSTSQVKEINPAEEGEIKIVLRIKNKEELSENQSVGEIILVGEAEARIFHQQPIIFKVSSNQITIKLPQ